MELPAKSLAELVGARVDQRVDELTCLGARLVAEHDQQIAVMALELRDDPRQRMARIAAVDRDFLRAISADDQDPAALDPPREMEQQARRGFVDPVQVVEYQDQRASLRELDENGGDLLEDPSLVGDRRRRWLGLGLNRRVPLEPATLALARDDDARLGRKAGARDE